MTTVTAERLDELIVALDSYCVSEYADATLRESATALRELRSARAKLAGVEAERDAARKLILDHNDACARLCGETEADKGVACKYRPYFPRHCPECPEKNWTIEAPWLAAAKGDK